MKSLVRLAALVCALSASAVASATSYNFTYSFASDPWFTSDPIFVTGSFDGVGNGNLISNLTNISVSENTVSLAGSGSLFSSTTSNGGIAIIAGVASLDGKENNFNFTDGKNNNFQMQAAGVIGNDQGSSSGSGSANGPISYTASLNKFGDTIYVNDTDTAIYSRWTITAVSAVPEPETYAMLLAGLGLVGLAARRRRASGTAALAA